MKLRCTNPTLLLYLAFAYAIPATLNVLLSYESEIYVNPTNGFITWLYAGLLLFITAAFAFRIEGRLSSGPIPVRTPWRVPVKPIIAVLVGLLIVSSLGAASGLSRWRYAEEGLSESLNLM
jgi:hypothetical protein